ncbi:MAG: insulinase family protein [Candidatus Aminicenantes bacterium]|nr:insulinase family protein [Candidatus Aminicenantes bacterium]
MKRFLIFVTIVFFLVGSTGFAAKKKRPIDKIKYPELNTFKLPTIEKTETSNGIKLRLIKTEKLPLVDLRIVIKGGSVYIPYSKAGLSSITAQLLRIGGTKKLSGEEVDKFLDTNGITISISAQTDYYSVYLNCLKDNLDNGISILSQMLQSPRLDDEKLEEIKTQISSGISRRNDVPSPINSREFNRLIYGAKSPFARVIEYEHLDNISKADILKVHKLFFAPGNMLVGVTGPVEINDVKGMFEKYFGKWSHQASVPPYPKVKKQTHDFKVAFAEKENLNQSYLSIGHLGVKEDLSVRAKQMVFNNIFSQGMDSRLFTRVRTKMGLTYGIGGGIITERLYPGKTYFSTFTKSESTIKAIKAIFEEIDLIRKEKVTPKELKDAKDYFFNSYVFKFSSPDRILYDELQREFYNLSEGYSQKIIEDIKKVTTDDVLEVAKKYLHPDKMIVFVLCKEKDLDGKLSDLGKVKKIDISIKPPVLKEKIPAPTPETLKKGGKIITALLKKEYRAYRGIKSIVSTSDASAVTPQGTFQLSMRSVVLYPDKSYQEIIVMGMKMETIINGTKGVRKQMGQEHPIPEKDIINDRFGDVYDIVHSKGKYKFQYLKETEINKKKYDVIYIFDAKKNWVKFYINKKTRFIEITEKIGNMMGQKGILKVYNSDFKKVNGIPFAYKTEIFMKDKKVVSATVKSMKVNSKVDTSLFNLKKK